VVTVPERGCASIAAISPTRSPGPRTATIASRPAELSELTFARPTSSTITDPASSPW
jgi:hypothetical protein